MTSTTPPEAGSELATFLARLQQLPPARARAAAAILASAVGDAAARPLHWIYNREELHTLLETRVTLAVVWKHTMGHCCDDRRRLSSGRRASPPSTRCPRGPAAATTTW